MKFLIAGAVVAMLVLAPIGSYFYLQSGLKYRLESQEQLKAKEVSSELLKHVHSIVTPKTAALIHLYNDNNESDIDILKKIDERIVDRDHFEIISYADPTNFLEKNKIRFLTEPVLIHLSKHRFMLMDSSGVVRNTYPGDNDFSKELIRHLAVVIPLPKSRDIRLKRELER